jgi:UPF0755 protein
LPIANAPVTIAPARSVAAQPRPPGRYVSTTAEPNAARAAAAAAPDQGARPAPARPPAPPPPMPPVSSRAVPGAGEPYPPLQSNAADGASMVDPKPIAPRSPRAALQPADVPLPSRRLKRSTRNPIVIAGNALLTAAFVLVISVGVAFVIGKQRLEVAGPLGQDKIVNIPRGGIRDTAELLVREGVIDQPYLFTASALIYKTREDLKSGEYQFTKNASLREVLEILIEGKVVQHALTLAEGLTSDQIVQRLLENEVLAGNIREIPREGTMLPETYRFTRGTTRENMLKRMQEAQRRAVQEIWERRMSDLPIRSPDQLVVLASIVEKETGKPEERTRVAAVFVNRLKQRMKLQSDPTIIYGLVGGKGSLGRPIMRSEIDQPTPYNTYVIDGLPPGPIANPGRASLEAAANPARTRELFFVADGSGGHAFADNYEQHQRNVARLRAIEAQANQRGARPVAPAAPSVTAPAFAPRLNGVR